MKSRNAAFWVAALAAAAIFGWLGYREFRGGVRFDEAFYATSRPAGPFSYEGYAAALKYVDNSGMVDYAALKANRTRLDAFCRALADVDPQTFEKWDDSTKIAFWINAYNALTLKTIVDQYPIKAGLLSGLAFPRNSIRQIPGVWDKLQFLVLGRKMTLNQIEHEELRGKFQEPRIHMALVCAAASCPPLRNEPYTGPSLSDQLDDQTGRFLSHRSKFRIDRDEGTVHVSKIFRWFGGDFAARHAPATQATVPKGLTRRDRNTQAVLNFIAARLPRTDADYIRNERYQVEYLEYDWSLNERRKAVPTTDPAGGGGEG